MTVLILAADNDVTADAVVDLLNHRGTPVLRCDLAWLPERLALTGRLDGGRWVGTLRTPERTVALDDVRSVWWRKPTWPTFPDDWTAEERHHAEWETRFGLGGVLKSLDAAWFNPPSSERWLAHKPLQLARAVRCGFDVPATYVGSDPAGVKDFLADYGEAVIKPLAFGLIRRDGVLHPIYTHKLEADDLADLSGIETCPHLVQEWVPKSFEVRLTAIERTYFAATVHAGSAAAAVDFRSDYDSLTYDVIEVPPQVAKSLDAFLDQANMRLATFDFAVTPDGSWRFFECNGAGSQYGWIEAETGLPITATLADALEKGRH